MEGCPPQKYQHALPVASAVKPQELSQCQKDKEKAKSSGAADIFVPECEKSGLYKEVQCYSYPASGKTDCWCVNQTNGSEVPGTRVNRLTPICRGIDVYFCLFICLFIIFVCSQQIYAFGLDCSATQSAHFITCISLLMIQLLFKWCTYILYAME